MKAASAALARDYLAATEYVEKSNPKADIIYYDTPLECFEAVNKGHADITYVDSYVAEQLLDNPKLNNFGHRKDGEHFPINYCIGVSDSVDPIFIVHSEQIDPQHPGCAS